MILIEWKGRQDDNVTNDGRDAYERDYARIVHSASFRRLQAKTQVLGLGDSDFYRTRLTHSLEVSQIGEGIARDLGKKQAHKQLANHIPDPSLIRAICLAHDLGHPPFGHGGEVALNRCMRPWGGFEGNGQTLRIITRLEPYHQSHGMNLTRRTVLGVLKYPAPYGMVVDEAVYPTNDLATNPVFKAKPFKPPKCYLDSETDIVAGWLSKGFQTSDWERFTTPGPGDGPLPCHKKTRHKTLDTSIMELADDIAYGIHDLEDAIALKLIEREKFADILPEAVFVDFAAWPGGASRKGVLEGLFGQETYLRKKVIGALVDFCVRNIDVDESNTHGFHEPCLALKAKPREPAELLRMKLQKLVKDEVIQLTNVQHLEFKGQKVVTELFEAFRTDPIRLLPKRDGERFKEVGGGSAGMRVICDYIAGMTDEYATKRYQQLFAPRVGSVFDQL